MQMECEFRLKEHDWTSVLCDKHIVYAQCAVMWINWKSHTCGHKVCIWLAAIWTIFVPSSFFDNEQARLATLNKKKQTNSFVSKYPSTDSQTCQKHLCYKAFIISGKPFVKEQQWTRKKEKTRFGKGWQYWKISWPLPTSGSVHNSHRLVSR